MNRNKKFYLFSIFLIIVSLCLQGCNLTKNEESLSIPKIKIQLTWYQYVEEIMPDQKKIMNEMNKYLSKKINATVSVKFLTGEDYIYKMPIIISSGQNFDVCFSTSWMLNYNEYVAKGAFIPLDYLIETYAKETKKIIPESYWNCMKIDEKIYGVPGYKEGGHRYDLIYNKDMAEELNLNMSNIKSLNDLENIFEIIKKKKPDVYGIGSNLYNCYLPHEHISGDWSLPGVLNIPSMETYDRSDDKIFNQYETPEYRAYAKKMYEWNNKAYFPSGPVGTSQSYKKDMINKKLFSQIFWYAPGCEKSMEKDYDFNIGFIPMHKPIIETTDATSGAIHVISNTSKYPEKSMKFINLLYSDKKLGTLIRHGIEDKNYIQKDNQIKIVNDSYDYGAGWEFGTVFNQIWTTDFPKDIEQQYKDYNNSLVPTTGLGFLFNYSKVKNEINGITNVLDEYLEPMNNGLINPDIYIQEFNEKLKENGLERYMQELQTQFDIWKSKQ